MALDRLLFDEINANFGALEIDEIKKRLGPFIRGSKVTTPIFDPGAFLYCARKIGSTFRKQADIKLSDLSYPPKHLASVDRLPQSLRAEFDTTTGPPWFFQVSYWRKRANQMVAILRASRSGVRQANGNLTKASALFVLFGLFPVSSFSTGIFK